MPEAFHYTESPLLSLSVLLVEDNIDDVDLCLRVLRKAYPESRCDVVKTAVEFAHQIRKSYYDVVLADYALGPWTGLDAFNLMRTLGRDIPFILVTGALGDERAIDCVKSGITDYVLKGHWERLSLAISRALQERALLEEHKRAEHALRESDAKFQMLADAIPAATFIEHGNKCTYANRVAEKLTGYSHEELLKMNFWELVLPATRKTLVGQCTTHFDGYHSACSYNLQIRTKDRRTRWLNVTMGMFECEGGMASLITAVDISDRRTREDEMYNPMMFGVHLADAARFAVAPRRRA